ncbi:MAG TPA: hypothetical protein VJ343_01700, partial [archaeon]|nr:hypothetical protein [archaeon]
MEEKNPRELIVEALMKHPEGLTLVSLAEVTGLHRHTSTKYLHELIGAGVAYQRKVGPARLCYLKEKIDSREKERKVLEDLNKKWIGKKSQIKFISVALLLSILLASGVVLASNISNGTFNVSYTGESVLNSTPENFNFLNTNVESNETVPNLNELNTSLINSTENETQALPENPPIPEQSENNSSLNDTQPPTFSEFGASIITPIVGETVEFHAFWQDDFGLDKWIFSWNASGTWENETHSFISSYDGKTQILTKDGWKYFRDLGYNDEVAVISDREIKWEKPLRIISLYYDNGIYRIDGKIDLLVTPDHQVYARFDDSWSFFFNSIRDLLLGANLGDFKFIDIKEAYEITNSGNRLTFLDGELNPVYVSKISKETYKGEIFDITVPSHIVLVKRFGKPVWSSNLNVKEGWSNVTKTVNSVGPVAFGFYASDLAQNWAGTDIGTIEVKEEPEITEPIETPNTPSQSLLSVAVDKSNYTANETVNLFGEVLLDGIRADTEINLSVEFNETQVFSTIINSLNGSYSSPLFGFFEKEGYYTAKVLAVN